MSDHLADMVSGKSNRADFHESLATQLDAEPAEENDKGEGQGEQEGPAGDNEPGDEVTSSPTSDSNDTQGADAKKDSKRYFLTRLNVEGFRGINNEGNPLDLRFDIDKVNSVYAENGFGKSSLFDALSFAILGKLPKLERLDDKENAGDYYNNRFHAKRHATIELTFVDDKDGDETTITVERNKVGTRQVSSKTECDPETFLATLQNDFLFLDQAVFERFIREPSQERGQCFTRLLGLSTLADYTGTLKKLADTRNLASELSTLQLNADKKRLEEEKRQLMARLRADHDSLIGESLTGAVDVVAYATRLLGTLQRIPVIASHCQVDKLSQIDFDQLQSAIKQTEGGKQHETLTANKATLKTLCDLAATQSESEEQATLGSLIDERAKLLEETAGPLLLDNYRTAIAVLKDDAWDDPARCPTCEVVQTSSLLDVLQEKVSAYEQAESKGKEVAAMWRQAAWGRRWQTLAASTDLKRAAGDVEKEESVDIVNEPSQRHRQLATLFVKGEATRGVLDEAIAALAELEKRRELLVERLTNENEAIAESLPESLVAVSNRVATAQHAREQLTRYVVVDKELRTASWKLHRREAWEKIIKQAYEDFKRAEVKWVRSREAMIAKTCQEMHLAITGNEDIVPGFDRPSNSSRSCKSLSSENGFHRFVCIRVALCVRASFRDPVDVG